MTNGNHCINSLFYANKLSLVQAWDNSLIAGYQGDMSDEEKFLDHIGKNYESVKTKLKMLCARNKQKFSEDSYHDVVIKCHQAIKKKGKLNDTSPYGIESYLIRSYFNHEVDLKRVANVAKRDLNYNSDNINQLHEHWYNSNHTNEKEKIKTDLWKDFSTLYIMMVVERHFDQEHFYLFRLKELVPNMTYKKLRETTHLTGVRQKVIQVRNWLQENLTRDEVNKAFQQLYGDLL